MGNIEKSKSGEEVGRFKVVQGGSMLFKVVHYYICNGFTALLINDPDQESVKDMWGRWPL